MDNPTQGQPEPEHKEIQLTFEEELAQLEQEQKECVTILCSIINSLFARLVQAGKLPCH